MFQILQERADKICEMASVMNQSILIDEERQAHEQELVSRLLTENKVMINGGEYLGEALVLLKIDCKLNILLEGNTWRRNYKLFVINRGYVRC